MVRKSAILKGLVFLLIHFACIKTSAQSDQKSIDSLLQLLSKSNSDTNRIKILNAISYRYFTIDPKLGLQYGEEAKNLSEKLQWKKGLAGANKSLGTNYWALKESVKAQDYFWAALKISEELHDELGIAKGIHSLGVLYGTNGDYATALDCYQKAANIFEKLGDLNGLAGCYSNIASMFEGLGKTEEMLKYYRLSLALAEKLNNTYSTTYYKALLGTAYFRQGDNETALKLGVEALKIFEKLRIPDLNYSIEIDPDLELDKSIIPNMILQPYLENAIWHGLKNKRGEKRLELNIFNLSDRINYQIKDNGIGRQKAAELKSLNQRSYRSKGMELLSKRFNLLSKEYGDSVSVEITDITELGETSGTVVNISVPVSISKVKTVV